MFDFKRKSKYDFGDDGDDANWSNGWDEPETDEVDDEPALEPTTAAPVDSTPAPAFTTNHVLLKIVTPKKYEDAREITDFLMNGNTVLLNMDGISRELAVRVIDYLRGAVQVVGGMMTKVGKTTLVVAPKNVDVSSIEEMVGNTAE